MYAHRTSPNGCMPASRVRIDCRCCKRAVHASLCNSILRSAWQHCCTAEQQATCLRQPAAVGRISRACRETCTLIPDDQAGTVLPLQVSLELLPEEVPLKVASQILFVGKATRLMAQTSRRLPLPTLRSQQVSRAGSLECPAQSADAAERPWRAG